MEGGKKRGKMRELRTSTLSFASLGGARLTSHAGGERNGGCSLSFKGGERDALLKSNLPLPEGHLGGGKPRENGKKEKGH